MWVIKDGWFVGVIYVFVWKDGKIWLIFVVYCYRIVVIRCDNCVLVNVSFLSYGGIQLEGVLIGVIMIKGKGEFFEDEEIKKWFYLVFVKKVNFNNLDGEVFFNNFFDFFMCVMFVIIFEKYIMYNSGIVGKYMVGIVIESELGECLEFDVVCMNEERKKCGFLEW